MKKLIFLFATLTFFMKLTHSQPCTLQHTNASGIIVDWNIERITSDYGRRNHSGTRWHKGIDYMPANGAGLRIVTLSPGRVTKLFRGASGYTILVIEGGEWNETAFQPNNSNFGYGHIFQDGAIGNGLTSGNFVLLKMKHSEELAILDLNSNPSNPYIVIGPVPGKVDYDGQEYEVTQRIDANQQIAPIGGSGGYTPHIHLYLFQNPNDPGNIETFPLAANCRNPLQLLLYPQLGYQIRIEGEDANDNGLHNLTPVGSNTFFPGDIPASIIVKDLLNNAGNTSTYGNTVKDTDSVRLYIKKNYEFSEAYRLIQGHKLESKIFYGGRHNGVNIYPTDGNPTGNTGNNCADITNNSLGYDGSTTRTGINPYAYSGSNPRPFDLHYFSDIYTRIKNDHVPGTPLVFAPISKFARYPDSRYDLLAKITTIQNVTHPSNNNHQRQIIIDNFKPYVEKIEVIGLGMHYSSEWVPAPILPQLNHVIGGSQTPLSFCYGTTIRVTFSEPMQTASLSVGGVSIQHQYIPGSNPCNWSFYIAPMSIAINSQMSITGTDMAGNDVFGLPGSFTQQQGPVPFSELPVRTSDGWSVNKHLSKGEYSYTLYFDQNIIGCETTYEQPPSANFDYSYTGNLNSITFTNTSQNAYSCHWDFGNGASSSQLNPGPVTYPVLEYLQTYNVELIVWNADGLSNSITKSLVIPGYSTVAGNIIDISSSSYIWLGNDSYRFYINAYGASSYDITLFYGDGNSVNFNNSVGFHQQAYVYATPNITTSYTPFIYCIGYNNDGSLIDKASMSLFPISVSPGIPEPPVLNVTTVNANGNTIKPTATEPFRMKAVLPNSQADFDWEWRIYNTMTPGDNSLTCNQSIGCKTFTKNKSQSFTTPQLTLPLEGNYKTRLWLWNSTFSGWFDYDIVVGEGSECIKTQILLTASTVQMGSSICFENNSAFPTVWPLDCVWIVNGVVTPKFDGISKLYWYLNTVHKLTLQSCTGYPFYNQVLTANICLAGPSAHLSYGPGYYKHTFNQTGVYDVTLKAQGGRYITLGQYHYLTPQTESTAFSTTTRKIKVVDCDQNVDISSNWWLNYYTHNNAITSGVIYISIDDEDIIAGNTNKTFMFEAYDEIVINSFEYSASEFRTLEDSEVIFTIRERPPLINCTLVPPSKSLLSNEEDELQVNRGVSIFPNPTDGVFNIKLEDDLDLIERIIVTNNLGLQVFVLDEIFNRDQTISLMEKPNGFYFINVITTNHVFYNKIVVKLK